jgi:opacity protein-like surface antigen
LRRAFDATANQSLLIAEHYSYFRQGVNLGADYRVNQAVAFTAGYTWKGDNRTDGQGRTSSHTPQVGVRLAPTDWLSLNANYALTSRSGTNFTALVRQAEDGEILIPLTYKFYVGSLIRNNFNFIAEVYPVNTVTCSFNFSIYNDNFTNSTFGIQSDRGYSLGADVSWRPHDRIALSLGYDHQQLQTRELAATNPINADPNLPGRVIPDEGPTLTTSDSYDTFVARADIKLIPKKLTLTTRGSYSFANSVFHNKDLNNLHESYAEINTFLTYRFNDHWACRAGYIYQVFNMSNAYGRMFTQGITAAGAPGADQRFNTLDGFFRNGNAHLIQAFLQYKF